MQLDVQPARDADPSGYLQHFVGSGWRLTKIPLALAFLGCG